MTAPKHDKPETEPSLAGMPSQDDIPAPSWAAAACTRCGKCCFDEAYMGTLSATQEDIDRWQAEGRDDILQYVAMVSAGVYDLWVKDGEEYLRCPFLGKDRGKATYHCRIHETRPAVCRAYPVSLRQMVEDGCEISGEIKAVAAMLEGWRDRNGG